MCPLPGKKPPPSPSLAAGRSCGAGGQLPAEPKRTRLKRLKGLGSPLWSGIRGCLSSRFTPEGANFNLLQGLVILFSETHPIGCEASPEVPSVESWAAPFRRPWAGGGTGNCPCLWLGYVGRLENLSMTWICLMGASGGHTPINSQ